MIPLRPLSIPKGMVALLRFIQSLESIGQNMSTAHSFFFFFFNHKSHHSCSLQFQKLPRPFSLLFLVGKMTWKYYSSNSLNSGQMPDFFPFHHCSLFSLLLLILWSRAFASAKSNSFNGEPEGQNSEKETVCDSETEYICYHPWFCYRC